MGALIEKGSLNDIRVIASLLHLFLLSLMFHAGGYRVCFCNCRTRSQYFGVTNTRWVEVSSFLWWKFDMLGSPFSWFHYHFLLFWCRVNNLVGSSTKHGDTHVLGKQTCLIAYRKHSNLWLSLCDRCLITTESHCSLVDIDYSGDLSCFSQRNLTRRSL